MAVSEDGINFIGAFERYFGDNRKVYDYSSACLEVLPLVMISKDKILFPYDRMCFLLNINIGIYRSSKVKLFQTFRIWYVLCRSRRRNSAYSSRYWLRVLVTYLVFLRCQDKFAYSSTFGPATGKLNFADKMSKCVFEVLSRSPTNAVSVSNPPKLIDCWLELTCDLGGVSLQIIC